jgi:hypothetical protein
MSTVPVPKPKRPFVAQYRMRVRSVAGVPVTDEYDHPYPTREDGWQDFTMGGLSELMGLIDFWGCPVTIAPPERGAEFWSLELEDGKHDPSGSILDTSEPAMLFGRLAIL